MRAKSIMAILAVSSMFVGVGFKNPDQDIKPAIYKQQKPAAKSEEEQQQLFKTYAKVTKDASLIEAMEIMKGTSADFSRKAIMGENLSGMPIKVSFENLSQIGPNYANNDALGWKKGDQLYIYVNMKHKGAPAPALAALLSHEALHQDAFNSMNEETYAWTMEAAVWTELSEKYTGAAKSLTPLVYRENTLKKLYQKANYSDRYIRNTVLSIPGYSGLPQRSPGFEK